MQNPPPETDRLNSAEPASRWASLVRGLLTILIFAILFFLLQRLTFLLRFSPYERTTLWIPGALTFTALFILPYRSWWQILVGLCLGAGAAYFGDKQIPAPIALLSAPLHFTIVAIGVFSLRALQAQAPFASVGSLVRFVLIAGILVPLMTSVPGDLVSWMQGAQDVIPVAIRSFLCVALGVTIGTPAFTLVCLQWQSGWSTATWPRVLEVVLLGVSLTTVNWLVFAQSPDLNSLPALVYAPVPFLIWAALRFELLGVAWALLSLAYISTWNAINGRGPFIMGTQDMHVLELQLFLLAVAWPMMFLAVGVTERRQAFAQLLGEIDERRRTEERFRRVVELTPTAILMVGEDQRVLLANRQAETYFGYSTEELQTRGFADLFPAPGESSVAGGTLRVAPALPTAPTADPSLLTPPQTNVAASEHSSLERIGRRRDGTTFPAEILCSALELAGRQVTVVVVVDLTERRQAEQIRRDFVHASRLAMLGEFTTGIAHEINQPLGAILSNAEAAEMLLEQTPPPMDEVRRILVDIRNDDLRASHVIQRLRALVRRGEIERVPVPLESIITEVTAILDSETKRRGLQVRTRLPAEPLTVLGDPIHLQQVLINLMINGMDAMSSPPTNSQLEIRLQREGDRGLLAVQDSGVGLPAELIPRLFERFFSTKPNGMGMGLAISRSLIEEHGGSIWVESQVGRGTTFFVSLPLVPSADSSLPALGSNA
jgi:two-component system, LuxR family, sensor kinase FixL